MSILNAKHFSDEQAAYDYVEARVWPEGPMCPHCKTGGDKVGKLQGKSTRIGVYKCYACRKPFTVKVGTIFEDSKVQMHIWLQAIFLMCSSKKGISSNQLHRTLGVTLKTAWFMSHRIREAMKDISPIKLGGAGTVVEADETYFNTKPDKDGFYQTRVVASLVERGGPIRSFHVEDASARNIHALIAQQVSFNSALSTDEAKVYKGVGKQFKGGHESVNHSKREYVRGTTHTNTLEGFYSIFKRGMKGVYQHCDEKHLHRYLSEFDFRYTNRVAAGPDDVVRTDIALRGARGKRLTYRGTH
jgi:transposase-like protein